MSWMPLWSQMCIKCPGRIKDGLQPYCVHSCPNKALAFGDEADDETERLRMEGFRIFELPAWENSKEDIVYAHR